MRAEGLAEQPLAVIVSRSLEIDPTVPLLADPDSRVVVLTPVGRRARRLRGAHRVRPRGRRCAPALARAARALRRAARSSARAARRSTAALAAESLIDELFLAIVAAPRRRRPTAARAIVAAARPPSPRPLELRTLLAHDGAALRALRRVGLTAASAAPPLPAVSRVTTSSSSLASRPPSARVARRRRVIVTTTSAPSTSSSVDARMAADRHRQLLLDRPLQLDRRAPVAQARPQRHRLGLAQRADRGREHGAVGHEHEIAARRRTSCTSARARSRRPSIWPASCADLQADRVADAKRPRAQQHEAGDQVAERLLRGEADRRPPRTRRRSRSR